MNLRILLSHDETAEITLDFDKLPAGCKDLQVEDIELTLTHEFMLEIGAAYEDGQWSDDRFITLTWKA